MNRQSTIKAEINVALHLLVMRVALGCLNHTAALQLQLRGEGGGG